MKFGYHVSWFLLLALCVACQGTPSPQPTITAPGTETAAAQPPQANPSAAPTDIPSPTASATDTPLAPTSTQEIHLTGRIAFYSDRDGNPEIYTLQADGSQPQRLTNDPAFDDSPALSPDGRQIVFLTARHDPNPRFPDLKYEIYGMNVDGSSPLRLTNTEAAEDHPAWSPDGSKILFDADYDGDGFYEIYTMNPDGTGVARLTSNAANDQFADWSPDGAQIAFSSDRNGNWDIFVMDADGANQRSLTSSPNWELFPAWSPDGSLIAFNVVVSRPGNTDIFLMNADGSDQRQLTDKPGYDENPAWSPDGSQIIFQTRRDGHFELYVMSVDSSQQRPLAISPADELWPSWGLAAPLLSLEKSNQALGMRETYQVASGDLDGDDDLDVIVGRFRGGAEVWFNLTR